MSSKARCRDACSTLAAVAIVSVSAASWGSTAEAAPHLSLSPSVSSLGPGESVAIDVFVEDVTDLRLYEVVLEVTGADGGPLDLTDLTIDDGRGDFVFAGLSSLACMTDPDNLRMTCTPLSEDCVSVPAGTPAYLGTYTFTANTGTSTSFGVNIVGEPSTFLLDCDGNSITPLTFAHATVDVTVPIPTISLSPEVSTIGGGESVVIELFIENAAYLRLYEVVLDVTNTPGASLDLTDLTIDEGRGDFVFAGVSSLACLTDPDNLRITCTPLSEDCVDVPDGSPAYLGTYTFTANTSASASFSVNIADQPTTFVLDCDGNTISPVTHINAMVNVDVPAPAVFLSPVGAPVDPGDSLEVEVFIENVDDLRLYEIVLEVTGGAGGSLDLTDLTIDEGRGDFVFAGISSLACITDPDNLRMTCTPLSDDCVNVPAGSPAYLGAYTFTANAAVGETFEVNVVDEPATFLLNCNGNPITPFTRSSATVIVSIDDHPPVADCGGPYTCFIGVQTSPPCPLDGCGSYDPDEELGDYITAYGWELDYEDPYDFDEADTCAAEYVWDAVATYQVGLKVTDDPDSGLAGAPMSDECWTTVEIKLDSGTPSTEFAINPAGPDGENGWYITTPAVTLTAADPPVGGEEASGVCQIHYQYSDSGEQVVPGDTAQFEVADGDHILDYFAVDCAGNPEDPHSVQLSVDREPPDAQITFGPPDGAVINNTEVTFCWTGEDAVVSPEELLFAFCTEADCDATIGPFDPTTCYAFQSLTEGTYTIKVSARDPAGHVDPTPDARTFTVDLTPPEILQHTPVGQVTEPVDHVDITFSEQINPSTFTVEDVVMTGPEGPITVDPPQDQDGNIWRIAFPEQSTVGEYHMLTGPHIEDLAGSEMDQDGDGIPGGEPDDVYDASFTLGHDCNANGILDECDLDCGDAGWPCDVPGCGQSEDCNSNGVPDECDIGSSVPLTNGLALWLKADSVIGVSHGEPVGVWYDLSGSVLDVSQPDPARQPVYISDGLNGLPTLRFDGNDFFVRSDVLGSSLTSTDEATVFLVEMQDGRDPYNSTLGWGTSINRFLLHTTWEDALIFQHGDARPGGPGSISVAQPPEWDDAFHLVEFFRAGKLGEIKVDGQLLTAGTFGDTPETDESHDFYIATDRFGNTFTGDIAEILVYGRALSTTERRAVRAYLSRKYGILGEPGFSEDCNENQVPDECDIADGTSADNNGNGVPDECEQDTALQFDGHDRVIVPNTSALNPPEITVESWVNFARLAYGPGFDGTDSQFFVCKGGDRTSGAYRLVQGGSGPTSLSLAFSIGHFQNGWGVGAVGPLETDHWYHVAGTYDGQTLRLFVDGVLLGSNDVGPIPVGNASPLYFSYDDVGGFPYYLTGEMDEVRIWNHARTQEQIAGNMYRRLAGPEPGLVGYWRLDEGFGQLVGDSSGSGNDGQLGSTSQVDNDDPTWVISTVPTPAGPWILSHSPSGMVNEPLSYVDITFSEEVNPPTFTVDDIEMTGPEGPITVDPPEDQGGNVWRIGFPEQSADGEYCLDIGPHIEGLDGSEMDQDGDGVPGEEPTPSEPPYDDPGDVYVGCFTIDMTPPEIIDQTPSGEVNGPVDYIDVTLSEEVTADMCSEGDIVLTGPEGEIAVDEPLHLGGNDWRIGFALQAAPGDYTLTIAPCFEDLADNPMAELYAGSFTIALPDLVGGDLVVPGSTYTGAQIDVSWRVTNVGDAIATGMWQDCVYLSVDDQPGGDTQLACVERPDELDIAEWYEQAVEVTISGVEEGDYWIILKVDDKGSVHESNEENNIVVAGPMLILRPNLTISPELDPMPEEGLTTWPITVGWTVTNTGDVPAEGTWQDCVYLSDDNVVGDDIGPLGCMPNPVDLAVEEDYHRVVGTFNIPVVPEGDYWIVVKANEGCVFAETDCGDNDTINGPFPVGVLPCADLVPSSVEIPPGSEVVPAGGIAYVDWVVTNIGNGPTNAPFWYDRVYLRDESNVDHTMTPDFQNPMALNPGESYLQNVSFIVPMSYAPGDYHVIVKTDATDNVAECDETNNIIVSDSLLQITNPLMPPILAMTNCAVDPPDPWPGDPITVTWTITNTGQMPTGPFTIDHAIVFSEDEILNPPPGDDVLAWHVGDLSVDLEPGETSQPISVTVNVPVDACGSYYIIVWPDPPLWVDLDRSPCAVPITVQCLPADLEADQPGQVVVPPTGYSGQPVNIAWTVRNAAVEPTHASWWDDKVYLSEDNDLETTDDNILLGTFRHNGVIGFDETYTGPEQGEVVLPDDAEGLYYVFVHADADDRVYEGDWEQNNIGMAGPIVVTFAPPDLVVDTVTVLDNGIPAASVLSGTSLTVEWTVTNTGDGDTSEDSWSDRIYVSADDVLDGGDPVLATVPHAGALGVDQGYGGSRMVTIPIEFSSPFAYVFVRTDHAGQVFESDDGNNDGVADPFEVIWAPPDLVVPSIAVDTGGGPGVSGSAVTIEWTIVNDYLGATPTGSWHDRIYISHDDVLDGSDPVLATVGHSGVLDPNDSYTASRDVTIPIDFVGQDIYILVKTDHDNRVYEFDNDNNVGMADPIEVIWGSADLLVESISAPGGAVAGEPLDLSWIVRNIGGPTTAGTWNDRVYLSADRWLSADDIPFDPPIEHVGDLAYNATYVANATVALPPDLADQFYLIVEADSDDVVSESDEANNTRYVSISLTPLPVDLRATSVDAPPTSLSGQTMQLAWTVGNFGIGATPTGFWRDAVYLSPDQYLDRDADYYLGYFDHSGILNPAGEPGDSYSRTESVFVPNGLSGPYYFFVVTDINDHVFEENDAGDAEDNNEAYDGSPTQVEIPPPADLVVTEIVVPPSGTLGEEVTIQWTVRNDGDFDAQGSWHDSVYISADTTWDIGDKKIGKVQHSGPLAPGAEYAPPESLIAPLPGVVPGDYYIIVRTDIHNEVRESIEGEQNNITPSTDQLNVNCWELALGVPDDSHQLSTGTEHYYQIVPDVPQGETLLVTLDCFDDSVSTELYLRCGAVPDRGHYDFAYSQPFAADHEIVVPTTQGGTCYVLARGDNVPETPAPYSVGAETLSFGIRRVIPEEAGNSGQVTFDIRGARFDPGTTVSLISPDQDVFEADVVRWGSQTRLLATVDLTGAELGLYDMRIESPGGEAAVAEDAVLVAEGQEPELSVVLLAPAVVRQGNPFQMMLAYVYTGNVDPVPTLVSISASNGAVLGWQADRSTHRPRLIRVLHGELMASDDPLDASYIELGRVYSSPIFSSAEGITTGQTRVSVARTQPHQSVEEWLRPIGMDPEAWSQIWPQIVNILGGSDIEAYLRAYEAQRREAATMGLEITLDDFYGGLLFDAMYAGGRVRRELEPPRARGDDVNIFSHGGQPIDPSQPTYVIIHGWRDTGQGGWVADMGDAIRAQQPSANIIIVDWHGPAGDLAYGEVATETVPAVARIAADALVNSFQVNPATTDVIGHSLGGQMAGYIGQEMQQYGAGLGRIDALDPAGPWFEGQPADHRLDADDAEFVQVLHTTERWGYDDDCGDYDINLLSLNPSWWQKEEHSDAYRLFTDTITNGPQYSDELDLYGFGVVSPEGDTDPDVDGDGIPNDEDPDVDGDGTPNGEDDDVDGDGIPNGEDVDIDGDGVVNKHDKDVDGDGILNADDPDVDGDGIPNGQDDDIDGDGRPNGSDLDVDGDGIPNHSDDDIDGDGVPNGADDDVDGDGTPNGVDDDVDGDGLLNDRDGDIDGDGVPNGQDNDIDGDGIPNDEDNDADGDGIPNDEDPTPNGPEGNQGELPTDDPVTSVTVTVVTSFDPNEKVAPAGFGEPLFVRPGADLPYTVRFENLPDASAPAQVVTVIDQLHANLDWRTFRLGSIAFGETVVEVPENRAHYSGEVDLSDSMGLIVDIEAGINITTGTAEWTLTAIAPDTGEIPEDPLAGLLPPNDPETHSGEGYVTFLIRALPDVPTGTEVTNTATIIFDTNEPIETDEVFNTIDSGAPTSSVTGPAGEQPGSSFEVCWTGEDDEGGSGIASYSLYHRLDGEPYTPWITTPETCATFTDARGGGTYDFYSIATDNVGNIEAPPEAPDTTVTIAVQVPFAPTVGTATATTVQLLDVGTANVGTVEHAVYVEEDGTDGKYVGADGRLQAEEEWLPLDDWAGVFVWQLTPETQYTIKAKARSPETEFGPSTLATTSIHGDVNGDGLVTFADLDLVRRALGTQYGDEGFDARCDLNGDDRVTYADLGIVRRNLGPPPSELPPGELTPGAHRRPPRKPLPRPAGQRPAP